MGQIALRLLLFGLAPCRKRATGELEKVQKMKKLVHGLASVSPVKAKKVPVMKG